ncbi:hypothetical protein [Thalassotalea ganghwensis]
MSDKLKNNNNNNQQQEQAVSLVFANKPTFKERFFAKTEKRNLLVFTVLLLFIFIAYYVFFKLPQTVEKPAIETDAKAFIAKEDAKPINESPFKQTQLAKFRQQAQQILSEVIDLQNNLEERKVQLWSKKPFEQALNTASQGDLFYRNQEFEQAIAHYNQALDALTRIDESAETFFQQYLTAGRDAIAEQDAETAKSSLELAMHISPQNEQAKQLFDRSLVLEQVIDYLNKGDELVLERKLEQAKVWYEKATGLDPLSTLARDKLEDVSSRIIEQNFSKAMSRGYQQLQNKAYDRAIKSFQQALAIKPNAKLAQDALEQSHNEKTLAKIESLLSLAVADEQSERWLQAQQHYKKALTLDPTLVKAKVGELRATARLALDTDLKRIIDEPNRLASENIYNQAKSTFEDALAINKPGKKLSAQISAARAILNKMKVPVSITLKSDNITQVTLYKTGSLGTFIEKELTLTPGEYTLVGTRDGFRDVREDFSLGPNDTSKTIVIQCNEKVTNG